MIEFLTLFLGLTWGVRPVEVAVGGPVAAVEIRLDGATAARIAGPPWKADCDFGQALLPHVLEAVALDAEGKRLAAARQTINFGRSEAEASLILGQQPTGEPAGTVRLSPRMSGHRSGRVLVRKLALGSKPCECHGITLNRG